VSLEVSGASLGAKSKKVPTLSYSDPNVEYCSP